MCISSLSLIGKLHFTLKQDRVKGSRSIRREVKIKMMLLNEQLLRIAHELSSYVKGREETKAAGLKLYCAAKFESVGSTVERHLSSSILEKVPI
jgi:hypothetical protein